MLNALKWFKIVVALARSTDRLSVLRPLLTCPNFGSDTNDPDALLIFYERPLTLFVFAKILHTGA